MKPVLMVMTTGAVAAGATALAILVGAPALKHMNSASLAQEHKPAATHSVAVKETAPSCAACGRVEAVRQVKLEGQATGAGAVLGGVAGAVIGHQIGEGRGKKLATVAGGVGGAVLGNTVEQNMKATQVYEITVRKDNGDTVVVRQGTDQIFAVGDKVKVVDGRVIADRARSLYGNSSK